MRPSTILYAVVLLATPAFTLPLVLVTPVGGPASKNTVRPLSGVSGTKFSELLSEKPNVRPLSGLSGTKSSKLASETPDDSDPGKMGLNQLEMDLEMNP